MPNHTNQGDYVSGAEFGRWMKDESDFRARIEKRMGDGFAEIKASVGRVESLQREANGRTSKAEQAIAVMARDLEAIKSEDLQIGKDVDSLRKHGCAKYEAHQNILGVLDGARSVTDAEGDTRPAFRLPSLSRKQQALAGVGISALLIPALAEVVKLGTELVRYLQAHP